MTCSGEQGHPRYQAGDPEDPDFPDGELLYRRYKRADFENRELLPASFQFPRQSFNRERYSRAEDVLHKDCCKGKSYEGWGVLACSVGDLPTPVDGVDGKQFCFSPMHKPSECCYAHVEIWCKLDDAVIEEPSRKVKEAFRVRLAQRMKILIEATV